MLVRFKVKNFKNFSEELDFNLERTNNYEFSENAVKDGSIKCAMIYGINGSGKSNLGMAMFDIIGHLTDKKKGNTLYEPYRNLSGKSKKVEFYYKFVFEEGNLEYFYEKSDSDTLIKEEIRINGSKFLNYDYLNHLGEVLLEGTGQLNTQLQDSNLSFVKYVSRNSVLQENAVNQVFKKFILFVDNMLLFYSLENRFYQGFANGSEKIGQAIIEHKELEDFEQFLVDAGIELKLVAKEIDGEKQIYCKFKGGEANFFRISSTGTNSLALFYYWYMQMKRVSLVFIDEFDAFYHYELADTVVRKLLELENTQVILTTHNTDLMSNDLLRPDCYFKLENGIIQSLAELTPKELRKAHNLQKIYKSGGFDV